MTSGNVEKKWRLYAACDGKSPSLWFPEYGASPDEVMQALMVCHKPCPVIEECLSYAVSMDMRFGIWGGEDFRLRKVRQRTRRMVRERSREKNKTK